MCFIKHHLFPSDLGNIASLFSFWSIRMHQKKWFASLYKSERGQRALFTHFLQVSNKNSNKMYWKGEKREQANHHAALMSSHQPSDSFCTLTLADNQALLCTLNEMYFKTRSIKLYITLKLYMTIFLAGIYCLSQLVSTLKYGRLWPHVPLRSDCQTLKTNVASICSLQTEALTRTSLQLALD